MGIRRTILMIGMLWLMGGCSTPEQRPLPAPAADRPTVALPTPREITPSAPGSAGDQRPSATSAPDLSADPAVSEVATEPPALLSAPPNWIAVASTHDPVEGIGTIDLVNIHTGQTHPAICPNTAIDLVAWSPDGRWVVCSFIYAGATFTLVDSGALSHTIDLTLAPAREPIQVSGLAWSADSQRLAVSTGAAIVVFHLETSVRAQELVQCGRYRCSEMAWSLDGQWLAYGRENGLGIMSIDGVESPGTALGILPPDAAPGITAVEAIAWSPSADQVAYATAAGVFVLPITGGEARQVADGTVTAAGIKQLQWSPGTTSLELTTADGAAVRLATVGSDAPVETSAPGTGGSAHRARSSDGQCIAELRQTGTTPIPWAEKQYDAPVYDLLVRYAPHDSSVVLQDTIVSIDETMVVSPAESSTPALARAEPAMRGCAVLELQARLQAGGYPTVAIDGVYGPETDAAVQAFQTAHALPLTGMVDPATWQVLRSLN